LKTQIKDVLTDLIAIEEQLNVISKPNQDNQNKNQRKQMASLFSALPWIHHHPRRYQMSTRKSLRNTKYEETNCTEGSLHEGCGRIAENTAVRMVSVF
jgi:hypothetical protein